ncbi:hypothetical protein BU23DRAFT_574404 [Bimuria novae-zelandiae CBS 107.79]|uniref:Uncharacterized protein n=1 Tax=Bimuria novae-zelandiae CBS 107.79 TaxID=1447943 RepID=A0A6A5UNS7_9PLEO|nr:hypothetical protein BU23DRAFT_574404 [Bimuria novae-zelandiae CBS 107.79]
MKYTTDEEKLLVRILKDFKRGQTFAIVVDRFNAEVDKGRERSESGLRSKCALMGLLPFRSRNDQYRKLKRRVPSEELSSPGRARRSKSTKVEEHKPEHDRSGTSGALLELQSPTEAPTEHVYPGTTGAFPDFQSPTEQVLNYLGTAESLPTFCTTGAFSAYNHLGTEVFSASQMSLAPLAPPMCSCFPNCSVIQWSPSSSDKHNEQFGWGQMTDSEGWMAQPNGDVGFGSYPTGDI